MTDTEKAALEKRIDELCAEVERLHADQAHWELGNCPSCPNVVSLQEALEQNAKLRELVARMAEALGIDCEWADPNWCKSPCVLEFECWPESDHTELRCPAWAIMHELGIEATA